MALTRSRPVRAARLPTYLGRILLFFLLVAVVISPAVAVVGAAPPADSGRFSVTKTDRLYTDHDGDNKADPGDVIEYTVTITSLIPTTSNSVTLLEDTDLFDDYLTFDFTSPNISPD